MTCPIEIEITDHGVESTELIIEVSDCSSGDVPISEEPDNRLERRLDGLYVRDRLDPDPVAYYLLSRG